MKKYKTIEVSEKQLEELIRKSPDLIEDELKYVDHQKITDRGPLDVLFVDSGNALVVAELKINEDDAMLVQAVDYYDYVTTNIEGFARAYKENEVDPTQKPRLFLVAPSFSISLLNRCKWIDIPISLYSFQCIAFEDNLKEIIPVFKETTFPSRMQAVEVYNLEERYNYITDGKIRKMAQEFLTEIQNWDKDNILMEPTKYDISIKAFARVFFYFGPRRKYFIIYTNDHESKWTGFRIHQMEDLEEVRILLKTNYEKYK